MINWHTDRRSRDLIAKLNKNNVELVKRVFFPADYYVYVGVDRATRRTIAALDARRTRAVEKLAGARFSDLETNELCRAYMAIDDQAPCVDSVLAEAFAARVADRIAARVAA